jgi:hypothetical protein
MLANADCIAIIWSNFHVCVATLSCNCDIWVKVGCVRHHFATDGPSSDFWTLTLFVVLVKPVTVL